MQVGYKFLAYPTPLQDRVLAQWMGASRFIWNAKCSEDNYFRKFANKFTTKEAYYATHNASYSHFKTPDTAWLNDVPSQLLRNSASNYFFTKVSAIKGICGFPKYKKKGNRASIYLTNELFAFKKNGNRYQLFIGTKTNNVGMLKFKAHRTFTIPNSLTISQHNGQWYVSFNADDGQLPLTDPTLNDLHSLDIDTLTAMTLGIDRGVTIPVCTANASYDYSPAQKRHLAKAERTRKRLQRKLARQQKAINNLPNKSDTLDIKVNRKQPKAKGLKPKVRTPQLVFAHANSDTLVLSADTRHIHLPVYTSKPVDSNRRAKTRKRIAKTYDKQSHIRQDFCHQTSRQLVAMPDKHLYVFEDLKTKHMTKRAKAKKDANGNWLKNGAKAKSGLNKAILNVAWYQLYAFTKYKAERLGKLIVKVAPHHTSQECAECGHIHPDNRLTQSEFKCLVCGHIDHADHNASIVIGKRAIKLIQDTGTVLSKDGLLSLDTGRGGDNKTTLAKSKSRSTRETSKKKLARASGNLPL